MQSTIKAPKDKALTYTSLGRSKYKLENLIPKLGKREQRKLDIAIKATSTLSRREKSQRLQMSNPKDIEGLDALRKRYWHDIVSGDKKEASKSLELIKLNNSMEGRKTQYECLGFLALETLMNKINKFLIKQSESKALQEFEKSLVKNSNTVLKLNGRTYVEDSSLKKCFKATPLEIRNLEAISQEAHSHDGKKLFPIDGILRTVTI
jgi:hypothetical protein